jgi:hypothetical protein
MMISGRIYDNMRAIGLDDRYVNSDLGYSRTVFAQDICLYRKRLIAK